MKRTSIGIAKDIAVARNLDKIKNGVERAVARTLATRLLATAIAVTLSPIPMIATTTPIAAQANYSIDFGFFYSELAPYGHWYRHPRWGDVWHPTQVEPDFRPYYRGYWVNTVEYGWTWNSEYAWGDIPFHYGRWVFDPYDGWLWVPGYVWAPAWVVWRSGGGTVGWFPMPPDDRFLAGYDVYRSDWDWNRSFGYQDWYGPSFAMTTLLSAWVFIELAHFDDRNYYNYVRPQNQYVTIINNTTNVTNYVTVNNRIINRSIDVAEVERASGRRIERVQASEVVNVPITTVEVGSQVAERERRDHGGNPNVSARERVRPLSIPAAEQTGAPEAEQRGQGRPQAAPATEQTGAPEAEQRGQGRPQAAPAIEQTGAPEAEQRGQGRPQAAPAAEQGATETRQEERARLEAECAYIEDVQMRRECEQAR